MGMKGVILAGGTATRLMPLTKVTNKHLLPVGNKPMLYHSIEKLVAAGITDIMVVSGLNHLGDVVRSLGSGIDFGCELTYRVQDEAGGIAQALGLARHFCGSDRFVVILGDNIFEDSLAPIVAAFSAQDKGARLLVKEVSDPERFGVATIESGKITQIEEKPSAPQSNMIVTGIYMYDEMVFDFVDQCSPSQRGELEISDVNQFYVKQGCCEFDTLTGWWTDAGTFESLFRANQLVQG